MPQADPRPITSRTAPVWLAGCSISALATWLLITQGDLRIEGFLITLTLTLYGPPLAATVVSMRMEGVPLHRIGFSRPPGRAYLVMVPLAVGVLAAMSATFALQDVLLGDASVRTIASAGSAPVAATLALVASPVAEEVLTRGVLFLGLTPPLSSIRAGVVSVLVFTAMHWSPTLLLPTALAGLVLTLVAARYRSILPCIVLHALLNVPMVAVGYVG